jgi:uncharacterized YigZ family protein
MENNDTYRTIESASTAIFKDKGSKFIAYAYPILSENEVKELVQALKKEHFSARHHCYAWRLGAKGERYRANDDGEPSGTAGRPILGQLQSFEVTNVLIVVVRYFGGTLLGVSGLINAYKTSANLVLNEASIVERIVENLFTLRFEYPLQNAVMKIIKDEQLEIVNSQYTMDCELTISVRLNKIEAVVSKLEKVDGVTVEKIDDSCSLASE